ncbi:MAG: FecR family protein [Candidatus Eisenbacteria bacterium]|nr:FecR family protein [Candidatus Eisenbacteria bacterium]
MKFRRALLFCTVLVLVAGPLALCFSQESGPRKEARVTLVLPVAVLERKGEKETIRILPNMIVKEGDKITTMKGSRVEITFPGSTVLRVDENTSILIEGLKAGKVKTRILPSLAGKDKAKVWGKIYKKEEGKGLEVRTPIALTGVEGTVFRIDLLSDSMTTVKVYTGSVKVVPSRVMPEGEDTAETGYKVTSPRQVSGPRQVPGPREVTLNEYTVILSALEEVTLHGGNINEKPVPRKFDLTADSLDVWVKWNLERDAR